VFVGVGATPRANTAGCGSPVGIPQGSCTSRGSRRNGFIPNLSPPRHQGTKTHKDLNRQGRQERQGSSQEQKEAASTYEAPRNNRAPRGKTFPAPSWGSSMSPRRVAGRRGKGKSSALPRVPLCGETAMSGFICREQTCMGRLYHALVAEGGGGGTSGQSLEPINMHQSRRSGS
jgi:hypothetical protein